MKKKHSIRQAILICGMFFLAVFPAFMQTVTEDSSCFDFIDLGPSSGNQYDVFTIGDNTQSFTATRWITPFRMNRYETTYQLWYNTRIKAEQSGYVFRNSGQEGSSGLCGKPPTETGRFQPVTRISWYEAIIWCNALSEQTGREPCYTYKGSVLRDSSNTAQCDLADCNWSANGYRLPTETEWEYAARRTTTGYQKGNLASGQINDKGQSDDNILETVIAWFADNTKGTQTVGTAGSVPGTVQPEPGSGTPNGAGLFDMSGNVLEYCWDWMADYNDVPPGSRSTGPTYGSQRVSRGGSWSPYTGFILAGDRYAYDPNEAYNYMGFRICTSK